MSFTKQYPGGVPVGQKITSTNFAYWDTSISNALDKSVAGDTLSGVVVTSGAGAIHAATVGGVEATIAGGIQATVIGGIQSGVSGGIELTGGLGDWPKFDAARTRTVMQPLVTPFLNTPGWTVGVAGAPHIDGGATASAWQPFSITQLHNGATLTSVTVFLCVVGPHSVVPAVLPQVNVYRRALIVGNSDTASLVSLRGAGSQVFSPTPATAAAWDNSNNMQSWTFTCDQNNVIDTTQYAYFISLLDENGTGAVTGNHYEGFELSYSNITNMQFP